MISLNLLALVILIQKDLVRIPFCSAQGIRQSRNRLRGRIRISLWKRTVRIANSNNNEVKDRKESISTPTIVEVLLRTIETLGWGVVKLDAFGRVVELNELARRLIKDDRISLDVGERLSVRNRQENRELQQTLSQALPQSGTRCVAGEVTVRRPDGLPSLVLRVTPVRDSEENAKPEPDVALVVITDSQSATEIDTAFIRKALRLTGAESDLVALLAQGKNVHAIAESTNRAVSTIRWHVKRILGKLGLTRQAELVHLVKSLGAVR